jgi:hypothetical protein
MYYDAFSCILRGHEVWTCSSVASPVLCLRVRATGVAGLITLTFKQRPLCFAAICLSFIRFFHPYFTLQSSRLGLTPSLFYFDLPISLFLTYSSFFYKRVLHYKWFRSLNVAFSFSIETAEPFTYCFNLILQTLSKQPQLS